MLNSIRWKIHLLYTAIAALMVLVFGSLTYVQVRQSVLRSVDRQLEEYAASLRAVLGREEPGGFVLELTEEQNERFQRNEAAAPYYQIWTADGGLIDFSDPERDVPLPAALGARDREGNREVTIAGLDGVRILVGRDTSQERAELRELALTCAAVGGIVLLLMLAGGYFLARRALGPIDRISAAAAAISESNLSQRIDPQQMEAELADLAQTINGAFDRLEEAFRRQTRFTADASHELRTPLTIIHTHADLALKRHRSAEEYQETLQTILRAAGRMRSTIEGLLTLARADAQVAVLEQEPFNVEDVVEEICTSLAPLAQEQGIHLVRHLARVPAVGDAARIHEAILNVVGNAVQHSHRAGQVRIDLRCEADEAVLTVADQGEGIPAAHQPFIFDRFYQADDSRPQSPLGGSGLGLAIVKWVIEAHGGSVTFTSREGEGATFVLRWNRGLPAGGVAAGSADHKADATQAGGTPSPNGAPESGPVPSPRPSSSSPG